MKPSQKTARMAGFFYLAYFVTFILADNGVHSTGVSVDVATVANHIMASERMFLIGFVCFLFAALFFLLSALALYALLKPVDHVLALSFLLLNLCGVALKCTSLVCEYAAMLLSSNAVYLQAFEPEQLQSLSMFFLTLYQHGFMMAQLFFGAWLLPLGYLVYKSGFLPRFLGILLMADFVAILFWFFQFFFLPDLPTISYPGLAVSFIAEASLCLWLLFKGVKKQPSQPLAVESIGV